MSIKQDLDNELNKRVSDKQKELDLVKESYEADKAFMLNYLKENDITTKLGDIVRWAREKGFIMRLLKQKSHLERGIMTEFQQTKEKYFGQLPLEEEKKVEVIQEKTKSKCLNYSRSISLI